jgi:hypothetical protein
LWGTFSNSGPKSYERAGSYASRHTYNKPEKDFTSTA